MMARPDTHERGSSMRNLVTGRVTGTERLGATVYGNPIMRVEIDGESFRLADDSGLAYGITNPEYRDKVHTFELSRAGRLTGRVYGPIITWADGRGIWHADVPLTGDGRVDHTLARRAIRDELESRGDLAIDYRVHVFLDHTDTTTAYYREA